MITNNKIFVNTSIGKCVEVEDEVSVNYLDTDSYIYDNSEDHDPYYSPLLTTL